MSSKQTLKLSSVLLNVLEIITVFKVDLEIIYMKIDHYFMWYKYSMFWSVILFAPEFKAQSQWLVHFWTFMRLTELYAALIETKESESKKNLSQSDFIYSLHSDSKACMWNTTATR